MQSSIFHYYHLSTSYVLQARSAKCFFDPCTITQGLRSKAGIRALIPAQIHLAPKPVLVCHHLQNNLSEGVKKLSTGVALLCMDPGVGQALLGGQPDSMLNTSQNKKFLSLTDSPRGQSEAWKESQFRS